jgi:hypothetical protein
MSWLNFAAGFAGAIAKDIEDRSEQIRKDTEATIARRAKEKAEAEEKAEQKRDQLKTEFRALRTVIPNLTEEQAVGIISNGLGDYVLKQASQQKLTADETQRLFKMTPGQKGMRFDEYLTATTTLKRGAPVASELPGDTGPFGLKLTEGERVRKSAIARSGYSEEQLGATKMGAEPTITGALDVGIFDKEKDSFAKRKDKAAMAMLDATTPEEKEKARNEWQKIISLENQGEAPSESSIRANFNSIINGVMRTKLSDKQYTTDVSGNLRSIVGEEGKAIFMQELRKGAQPLINTYNRLYADDKGRMPQSMVPALVASGIVVDEENRIKGFSGSMYGIGGLGPSDVAAASASKVDTAQDKLATAPPSKAPAAPKTGKVVVQTTQGPIEFPTQAQADQFKKAAGLK